MFKLEYVFLPNWPHTRVFVFFSHPGVMYINLASDRNGIIRLLTPEEEGPLFTIN